MLCVYACPYPILVHTASSKSFKYLRGRQKKLSSTVHVEEIAQIRWVIGAICAERQCMDTGPGSLRCASIWIMTRRVRLNRGHFSVSLHLTRALSISVTGPCIWQIVCWDSCWYISRVAVLKETKLKRSVIQRQHRQSRVKREKRTGREKWFAQVSNTSDGKGSGSEI